MPEMKYHLVKTDQGEFDIIVGTVPPGEEPADADEAMRRGYDEGWLPKGWQSLGSYDDEESAQAAREEAMKAREEAMKGSETKETP